MDCLVALLTVLAISLFFTMRFKLNAALAPFFTIALITAWLSLISMTGLLMVGVWLIFGFAIGSLVWVVWRSKIPFKEIAARFFTPGLCFFVAVSVLFYILLAIKQPYFAIWDEFSFWGTAAKMIFTNRQIYTLVPSGMVTAYPPALPLWSFFVQFFGQRFIEWKMCLAYDIMMMSVMTMLFARLKWKNAVSTVALIAFSLASLYMFWWTFSGLTLFANVYSDIPYGVAFGGILAVYFLGDPERPLLRWFTALTAIVMVGMMKDMGMALGLIAAGIISVDMVIAKEYPLKDRLDGKKKPLRLLFPLALFVAAVACYVLWAQYYGAVTGGSRALNPYPFSAIEVLTGKDPYFVMIIERMLREIGITQITTFGPMRDMLIVFTGLPILVGIFSWNKKKILRTTLFSLLMLAGFAAYYLFLAYLYTTVFSHDANGVSNLGRYVSSYCAGWLVAIVAFGVCEIAAPKFKKFNLTPGVAAASILVALTCYFSPVHPDQYVFSSYKINLEMPGLRAEIQQRYEQYASGLTAQDRIYYVCQDSDGGEWYYFNYEFLPCYTVPTLGGGDFVDVNTPDSEMGYYAVRVDRAAFAEFLREEEIDFVYVQKTNEYFRTEFAPMFTDELRGNVDKSVFLYMVVEIDGELMLTQVFSSGHIAKLREQYGISA